MAKTTTMKEKIAKMLHIEVNEGKQLGENINKIINDYYNLAQEFVKKS